MGLIIIELLWYYYHISFLVCLIPVLTSLSCCFPIQHCYFSRWIHGLETAFSHHIILLALAYLLVQHTYFFITPAQMQIRDMSLVGELKCSFLLSCFHLFLFWAFIFHLANRFKINLEAFLWISFIYYLYSCIWIFSRISEGTIWAFSRNLGIFSACFISAESEVYQQFF